MALDGKTALVTGAGRGIGEATAIELAKAGAETPFPAWKRIDDMQDILPERDSGKTDAEGGTLTLFEYLDKLDAGDARALFSSRP